MNPIIFAVLAALSFGLWTVFHKIAAPYINQVFGAIVVSFTAVAFGAIFFLMRAKDTQLVSDPKGVIFLVLAGVAAFFIDFLALQAYSKGLPVTIGGPIIIGGSIAIAVIAGFFMGDAVTAFKLLGILLLVAGAAILATASQ